MKIRSVNIFLSILGIFLILGAHSVYDSGLIDFHFPVLSLLTLIITIIVQFSKGKHLHKRTLVSCLIVFVYQSPILVCTMLSKSNYELTYLIKYMLFIPMCLCIFDILDKPLVSYIGIISNIIYVLSVVSLFFFLFATVLNVIPSTGSYFLTWNPARYIKNYFYVFFQTHRSNIIGYKNTSIFSEAPVFSAVTCFALGYELFLKDKRNIRRIVILTIATITSLSTTSYVYVVFSLIGIVYIESENLKRRPALYLIIKIIMIVMIGFAFVFTLNLLIQKRDSIGVSFILRTDDFRSGFLAFLDKPILGNGFGTLESAKYYSSARRAIHEMYQGQSSDFASNISEGGIWFMLIYIGGFIGLGTIAKEKKNSIIFSVLLIYLYIITRIGATLLFVFVISIGLHQILNKPKIKGINLANNDDRPICIK